MTAAIPDDIMYRAGAVVADICGDAHSDAQLITTLEIDAMAEHIARAIMDERIRVTEAERERCAAIAESHGDTWSGSRDSFQCAQETAVDAKVEEIAAAIRNPTGE